MTKPRASTTKRPFFWLAIAVLFAFFLHLIHSILLPFVLGIFMAYFLDPAVSKLQKFGLSRGVATLLVIVFFFLVIVMLGVLITPVLINQLSGLIATMPATIVSLERRFEPLVSHWLGNLQVLDLSTVKSVTTNISGAALKFVGDFVTRVFESGLTIVNLLSLMLITPVVAFYMLKDWHKITTHIDKLIPRGHAGVIRQQLLIVDRTLAGFVHGQINVCLVLATYYSIMLSMAQLKFGIIIGLMTGFMVILPYVGFLFGLTTALGIAYFQLEDVGYMGVILVIFLMGQLLEGYFLTPRLVGKKVGLHPVWIIFGMLSGAKLFGFVGILLAVPLTAVIGVLIRFMTERYLESDYYEAA